LTTFMAILRLIPILRGACCGMYRCNLVNRAETNDLVHISLPFSRLSFSNPRILTYIFFVTGKLRPIWRFVGERMPIRRGLGHGISALVLPSLTNALTPWRFSFPLKCIFLSSLPFRFNSFSVCARVCEREREREREFLHCPTFPPFSRFPNFPSPGFSHQLSMTEPPKQAVRACEYCQRAHKKCKLSFLSMVDE
jgi:hypothetical protein